MVANNPPDIVPIPLADVVGRTKTVPLDSDLVRTARALGVSLGLLPPAAQSLIVAGALLSIMLNPFVFNAMEPLTRWLRSRPKLVNALERPAPPVKTLAPETTDEGLRDHVVVVGSGRVGKPVVIELREHGIPYVVIEASRDVDMSKQEALQVVLPHRLVAVAH